ncbi:MAG: gluconolactonase [Planctomycetales bacterium]|nr:gluconolactonase [Planctomycetales bacterium]
MKSFSCLISSFSSLSILALGLIANLPAAQNDEETYELPPESSVQHGVPVGRVEGPFDLASQVFPGTERKYWIYIPAQYDAEKPTPVMIVQDGLNRAQDWRLPQVLDNLIHSEEVPVQIGIFVEPGVVPPFKEGAQPRFNRSFEYDSLGDRYARFLLEELIPVVARNYNISTDPNDRALAGASSGGICAFNAAWERPDQFRRILSTIGTYVGLRGGNQVASLVRKTEPKPLRIFLQDGSRDLDLYPGDWWIANQDMLSALEFAGYEVNHQWGTGGHNGQHAAAIMPQALRWLWKDYPQPIKAAVKPVGEQRIDILLPGSAWTQVSSGHEQVEAPACSGTGEFFFSDSRAGRIFRVGDDGKTRIFAEEAGRISSMSFGPKGNLYACRDGKQIVRFSPSGEQLVVLDDISCQSIVTMPDGFFFTDPAMPSIEFCPYDGNPQRVSLLTQNLAGLVPTADHAFMHLVQLHSPFTSHARLGEAHQLDYRQPFGFLHLPYGELSAGATGATVDANGNFYVATKVGVQVMDQLGRVNVILSKPSTMDITGISFGGSGRDLLYVTCRDTVYRRQLGTRGIGSFETPVIPPKPRL